MSNILSLAVSAVVAATLVQSTVITPGKVPASVVRKNFDASASTNMAVYWVSERQGQITTR